MEEGGRGSTLQPKTVFFLSLLSIVPTILYYTAYFRVRLNTTPKAKELNRVFEQFNTQECTQLKTQDKNEKRDRTCLEVLSPKKATAASWKGLCLLLLVWGSV